MEIIDFKIKQILKKLPSVNQSASASAKLSSVNKLPLTKQKSVNQSSFDRSMRRNQQQRRFIYKEQCQW